MTEITTKKLLAEIGLGRFDQDLLAIVEAIKPRITEGAIQVRWKLTHDDCSFTEDSVTIGEIRTVEKFTGLSWFEINPRSSAEQMVALLAAHNAKAHGMAADEALAQAEGLSLADVAKMLSEYQIDPKDDSLAVGTT